MNPMGLGASQVAATLQYSATAPTSEKPVPATSTQQPASPTSATAAAPSSGATAQTSGFVSAGSPPSPTSSTSAAASTARRESATIWTPQVVPSGFGVASGGLGGGLASSPNVPRPGTSIDPSTGKPHTAGLTRAELEAIKSKGADLLAPSPLAPGEPTRRASYTKEAHEKHVAEQRRLSELSGREQAARQLTTGLDTPATKPVTTVGTGPNVTSSIYEDVAQGLDKVGHAAYNLIPENLKQVISNSPSTSVRTVDGAPVSPSARRGSAAALFDRVRSEGTKLAENIQHHVNTIGRTDSGATPGSASDSILNQVKGLISEIAPGPVASNQINKSAATASTATAVVPKTSLPSDEPAGALPGEKSSGVGALPGSIAETGVAVLPDEKQQQNQQPRLGETGGLAGLAGIGAAGSSGSHSASHTAIVPTAAATGDHTGASASKEPLQAAPAEIAAPPSIPAAGSGLKDATIDSALSTGNGSGLAPPLPHTQIFLGAAHGATDLKATPGVSATPNASVNPSVSEANTSPATRQAHDRTTSMASVTAIRGGHEGNLHGSSPLAHDITPGDSTTASFDSTDSGLANRNATDGASSAASVTAIRGGHEGHLSAKPAGSPLAEEPVTASKDDSTTTKNVGTGTGAGILAAQAQSARSDGPAASTQTTSLTPGNEHEGVGHPSTRDIPGATRTPGTYPAADHDGPAVHDTTDGIASDKKVVDKGDHIEPSNKLANAIKGDHSTRHGGEAAAATGVVAAGLTGATAAQSGHAAPAPTSTTGTAPTSTSATSPATATSGLTDQPSSTHTSTPASTAASHHDSAIGGNGNGNSTSLDKEHTGVSGHNRTGSTSSNGKKKVGFMNKLKGEIKVIGGKIAHDEKKVEEGEKLKHGL